MSQMVTRKRTGGDEKEKRQTDSPVKDMKKKMAANAEKEKNATEKVAEKNPEKPADKPADKAADKPADKTDKPKADKAAEKTEKKVEKPVEKKADAQAEKKKEDSSKGESSAKTDKPDQKKHDTRDKPKQNGSSNGVNGTVSGGGDSDSDELVIDENDENDEIFPELAYDDSDVEWEPGMDVCPSRSLTRRSQVKVTRTPETPRPASDKQPETAGAVDDSKDSKVLKLNQESKTSDSPKPETKKAEPKPDTKKAEAKPETKKAEAPKVDAKEAPKPDAKKDKESPKEAKEVKDAKETKDVKESPKKEEGKEDKSGKVEIEVVVDIEHSSESSESRKPDTNFSKSRVKVSPYRRSLRLADQTTSSVTANYTGNNTTMEMDITESSSILEGTLDDSSYLGGLKSIRGRRSYKPLQEMTLRHVPANRSVRSTASITVSEHSSRPTGTVVGRKRKPDGDDNISLASEAEEFPVAGKRQRLLDRIARPFRRTLPARRNAEIVGINTDLPLTAPVASTDTYDPETLKAEPVAPAPAPTPVATPEEAKRCVVM